MRRLRIAIGLLASLLLLGLALTASATSASTGTQSWSYLVDASARLGLEEVRAQRQQFKPLGKQSFTFPPSDHAVWLLSLIHILVVAACAWCTRKKT